jgi:hypothetical protein
MHNILFMVPTARGTHPDTVACIFNCRTEIEKDGNKQHLAQIYRTPLDLVRNELGTVFLSTGCDIAFMLDDDCQIDPLWVSKMLAAIDGGCDIVSAPCRMRSEGNLYNIVPLGEPFDMNGTRVVECAWTGLGAVMATRKVFETLHRLALERSKADPCPHCKRVDRETYRSTVMPEKVSAAIFKSRVEPARSFFIDSPEGENVYLLDDRAFSLRAHEAGFKIHAAVDVPTTHDGMQGNFAADVEKLQRMQEREANKQRPRLVGADGRPVSR